MKTANILLSSEIERLKKLESMAFVSKTSKDTLGPFDPARVVGDLPPSRSKFGNRFIAYTHADDSRPGLGNAFESWIATKPFVLQKPHRCTHKMLQIIDHACDVKYGPDKSSTVHLSDHPTQVIMVEHDWGALLGSATISGGGGEWTLPYDIQVFEFAISGAAVCAGVLSNEDIGYHTVLSIRLSGEQAWITDQCQINLLADRWEILTHHELVQAADSAVNAGMSRLYDLLYKQIKATCIMLEAEVVVTEPTRAPYNTNQPPQDGRKLPNLSHHIVKLARRTRAAPLPADARLGPVDSRRSPRLHLRRGHWRHYAAHKTWIKWQIVGDLDLGIVTKDYTT